MTLVVSVACVAWIITAHVVMCLAPQAAERLAPIWVAASAAVIVGSAILARL